MLDFLFENVFLVGLVIISGILLFFPKIFSKDVKALSAREVTLLINREPSIVIDIRAETDFMNGHITNAINIPLETIEDQVAKFKNLSKKNIILCCQKGIKSNQAFRLLSKLSFEKLYTIDGGIDDWVKNNLPVVDGKK